jgi:hypothetical protein
MLCQLATLPEIEAKIFDETALFFEDWRAQEIKSGAHPYDATKDEFYRRVTFLDYVKALNELCSKKPVVALPDTVEEAAFRKMLTLVASQVMSLKSFLAWQTTKSQISVTSLGIECLI